MKKCSVFYFSGTGNSFYAARHIAENIGADLKNVTGYLSQEKIRLEAEVIGLVFPVYDFTFPPMTGDFINKLEDAETKEFFVVAAYGITPLSCIKKIRKLIERKKGVLKNGFTIRMPHNALGSMIFSHADFDRILERSREKLKHIINELKSGHKGKIESSFHLAEILFSGQIFGMLCVVIKLLFFALRKGWNALAFISNERCTGCGTCSQVCPMKNILMESGKPQWQDHCAGCFACLQWCPSQAVQLGTSGFKIRQYHHPEVSLHQMIESNTGVKIT